MHHGFADPRQWGNNSGLDFSNQDIRAKPSRGPARVWMRGYTWPAVASMRTAFFLTDENGLASDQ